MLRACSYCGRIHDTKFDCGKKPVYNRSTKAVHIRNTSKWQRKRDYIRDRDSNLCQLCLINYEGTRKTHQYDCLSVHHITRIEEDESLAFDDYNLVTLCDLHHEMADQGRVPKSLLLDIAKKNTDR